MPPQHRTEVDYAQLLHSEVINLGIYSPHD